MSFAGPAKDRSRTLREARTEYLQLKKTLLGEFQTSLLPPQLERLKQLVWQAKGIRSIFDVEVSRAISFTNLQEARINELVTAHGNDLQALTKSADASSEKLDELERRYCEALTGVLTEAQHRTLRELQGPEFRFVAPHPL